MGGGRGGRELREGGEVGKGGGKEKEGVAEEKGGGAREGSTERVVRSVVKLHSYVP